MNSDETGVIEDAKKGSGDAFDRLFARERKYLFNLMFQLTGDVAAADDLTQEAMIAAFHKISTFQLRSSFRTWLSKIAINLFRAQYRKKPKHTTFCLEEIRVPSTDNRPEKIIIKSELQYCIRHNLRYHLPEKYRLVLILRDLHNLSYKEISVICGLNLSQTKTYLHRARKMFRKQFIDGRCQAFTDNYLCICEGILDL